jgi:hypothetical protein
MFQIVFSTLIVRNVIHFSGEVQGVLALLLQSKDQAWFIFLPCGFLFIPNQFGPYLGDAECHW